MKADATVQDRIRKYYNLPESVTDEYILKNFGNTLGAARINLSDAIDDLKEVILEALPQCFKRHESTKNF